jgi:hypothetical protein
MNEQDEPKRPPGTVVTWEEKRQEIPKITGDEELIKRIWQDCDAMAYMYIWQVLLSF